MRISIAVKLLLSYAVLLAVCLLPGPLYLRGQLQRRLLSHVQADLGQRAQSLAVRLAPFPDAALDPEARTAAALLGDRVAVYARDGRALFDSDSTNPAAPLPRPDLDQAVRHGQTATLTGATDADRVVQVTRTMVDSTGRLRGFVRLTRPVGEVLSALASARAFDHRLAGVASSLCLILLLGYLLFVAWPLRRLRAMAQAYARGEFTAPAPERLPKDEVGDLGQSLVALSKTLLRESVRHSAEAALRQELIRVLPLPLALLDTQLGPLELNPAFREATDIDPATEQLRLHQLAQLEEVRAARAAAAASREPQSLPVRVPWRRAPLLLTLWPLPALSGQVLWAVGVGPLLHAGASPGKDLAAAVASLLVRSREVLEEAAAQAQRDPAALGQALRAHLLEIRALADAAEPPPREPEAPVPVDLRSLLRLLLSELQPLLQERRVTLEAERLDQQVLIAECGAQVERGLRLALCRAVAAAHPRRVQHREDAVLTLEIHLEPTAVHLSLHGLRQSVPTGEIDRLLAPVGGGATLDRAEAEAAGIGAAATDTPPLPAVEAGGTAGTGRGHHELWLTLRRA